MDIKTIDHILAGSFFLSQVSEYIIGKLKGTVENFKLQDYRSDDLEYQFIKMLEDSLNDTFSEYDDKVVSENFNLSLENIKLLTKVSNIKEILELLIGQPVHDDLLNLWNENIKKEITKPNREWLYRYITFQNTIVDDSIRTATKMYARAYGETMFLHKNSEKRIRLQDVFIQHKYKNISNNKGLSIDSDNVLDYLKYFINFQVDMQSGLEYVNCLFIEGNAGCGKSSLVSYLADMYEKRFKEWVDNFGERELICIRLRDIIPDNMRFTYDSINSDILSYLNLDPSERLDKKHKNSIVILDGFDELCMVEKIHENINYYIYELFELFKECKIIITTRPQYINIRSLNFPKAHIMLLHFDKEQRVAWVNKYMQTSCEEEEKTALEYIKGLNDNDTNGICDTPMALYMLVAGRINEDAKQNNWVLYNQIFYRELSETVYNSIFPSSHGTYSHSIKKYKDFIYRVGAEISYEMYKGNNTKLYLTNDDITKIISGMEISDFDVREIVKYCYALCSYWKMDAEKGVAEFYHNNIRDFFMCEKIFYEMEKLYQETEDLSDRIFAETFAKRLFELFSYSEINTKVIEFLYLRVLYQKNKNNDMNFAKIEKSKKQLENFFYLLAEGNFSMPNDITFGTGYDSIINTLINTVQIFRHAYDPYLENEDSIITWFYNEAFTFGSYPFFINNFKKIFIRDSLIINERIIYTAGKANFSYILLGGEDLRDVEFVSCIIQNAAFQNAILSGANFEGSDLSGSIFRGAVLQNGNLKNCNLTNCIFTDAILMNTILPDGSTFESNVEAYNHLRELNIKGLII